MSSVAQQAMTWVPVLNVVLTMIFYAMFVVIFPLFLFPKTGVSTLKGYMGGFFYLAAWGPIYVLLHMFLMDRMARTMAAEAPGGLTLFGWGGADAVVDDMASMAGVLMMSVPVLAGARCWRRRVFCGFVFVIGAERSGSGSDRADDG